MCGAECSRGLVPRLAGEAGKQGPLADAPKERRQVETVLDPLRAREHQADPPGVGVAEDARRAAGAGGGDESPLLEHDREGVRPAVAQVHGARLAEHRARREQGHQAAGLAPRLRGLVHVRRLDPRPEALDDDVPLPLPGRPLPGRLAKGLLDGVGVPFPPGRREDRLGGKRLAALGERHPQDDVVGPRGVLHDEPGLGPPARLADRLEAGVVVDPVADQAFAQERQHEFIGLCARTGREDDAHGRSPRPTGRPPRL